MKASLRGDEHWTSILYERYADLYLPILEARRESGAVEAEGLSRILKDAGLGQGKVLDLACGIGRHSIPLAKLGYEVVGYDLSSLFVARAKSWAKSEGLDESKVRFYQGDTRTAAEDLLSRDEAQFDAIVSLFSSLGAYGDAEDAGLVEGLRKISSPGGLFVVETLNRDSLLKRFQPFTIHAVSQGLRLLDFSKFNVEESRLEDDWRFYTELPDGNMRLELDVRITGRVYTLHELRTLLTCSGWVYRESLGNLVTRGPVGIESPSIVIVCRNGSK